MLRRLQVPRRRVVAIATAAVALAAGLAGPEAALAVSGTNDSYELGSDGRLVVAAPGVLANDDLSCDQAQAYIQWLHMPSSTAGGGTVTNGGAGGFEYTPDPEFAGTEDSFRYGVGVWCHGQSSTYHHYEADVTISLPSRVAFGGFEGSLADPDALFTAGRVIPVVYRVTLDGQPVSDPAHFVGVTSQAGGACGGATGEEVDAPTVGSGLQYLGDGLWQYNWKTDRSFAGQCRTLVLTLTDQTQRLNIRFR